MARKGASIDNAKRNGIPGRHHVHVWISEGLINVRQQRRIMAEPLALCARKILILLRFIHRSLTTRQKASRCFAAAVVVAVLGIL